MQCETIAAVLVQYSFEFASFFGAMRTEAEQHLVDGQWSKMSPNELSAPAGAGPGQILASGERRAALEAAP